MLPEFAARKIRRRFRAILIGIGTGLGGVLIAACNEAQTYAYETLDDARRDGAIERGWVPAYIPNSARQLLEFHSVDSDESWLVLNCRTACLDDLRRMGRVTEADVPAKSAPQGTLPWLDQSERSLVQPERRFVTVGRFDDIVILDYATGKAYVWRRLRTAG
jgi:hypothetical protein